MTENEKDLLETEEELVNQETTPQPEEIADNQQDTEWQFDGVAPTLADNLTIADGYEITLPADKPAPKEEISESQTPATKPAKNDDKVTFILTAAVTVLIAIMLAILGFRYYTAPNTEEKMNPGNTAIVVGDTPVSIGMYNYCYTNLTNQVISSGTVDTSIPYNQQTITNTDGEEVTYEQYFKDITIAYLKEVTSYYEAGIDAGLTISADQRASMDEQLSYIKETATSSGMGINEYIQDSFGDYCGYATLEKMLEQHMIASQYQQKIKTEITCTDEEVEKFFDENSADYYVTPMAYAFLTFDETNKDKVISDAKKYCKEIDSLADMKKLVPSIYKDMIDQYVSYGYYKSAEECALEIAETLEVSITANDTSFGDEVPVWLFDKNTKTNDCSYFVDEESGYVFIVLKTGDTTLDKEMVYSVRHILVMPEPTEEQSADVAAGKTVEYTDEQWADAKTKAEDILAKFNAGDKTEFSFALLAEEYSDDTESTSNGSSGLYGGLYENITIGTMVKNFENWCIDDSRLYGDTGIVESEYGYHIMYFVDYNESYWYDCKTALKLEKVVEIMDQYEVKEYKQGMKKTEVAEITSE